MVLSNAEIVAAIKQNKIAIDGIAGLDPSEKPFNTSAVDLRLGSELSIPIGGAPVVLDLRQPNIAPFLAQYSKPFVITKEQPYTLGPHQFVLANTIERVDFPILDGQVLGARVEGKARWRVAEFWFTSRLRQFMPDLMARSHLEMINLRAI